MYIFATIGGVGFLFLLFSLIFGHDSDHDFHDIDSEVGGDSDAGGPKILSVKMIALMMIGFGFTGFGLSASTQLETNLITLFSMGGAGLMGVIGYFIIRMFYASQASSTITNKDVVGIEARLLDVIPHNGVGQIACHVRGREITYLARSEDGMAIEKNVSVIIVRKTGTSVIVKPNN